MSIAEGHQPNRLAPEDDWAAGVDVEILRTSLSDVLRMTIGDGGFRLQGVGHVLELGGRFNWAIGSCGFGFGWPSVAWVSRGER
jgi:hypothetical protein